MANSENNSGWRRILTNGVFYSVVQTVFSERRSKQHILDHYVHPAGSMAQILDIGCGPGNLASFLPDTLNYVGFDLNEAYIRQAQSRYQDRPSFRFIHGSAVDVEESPEIPDASIDVAIIHGVLHHVPDTVVGEMFALARRKLRVGGKMVVLEPLWFEGQSLLHKALMSLDRGENIKQKEDWLELFDQLSSDWSITSWQIRDDLIRFYDLIVLHLEKIEEV